MPARYRCTIDFMITAEDGEPITQEMAEGLVEGHIWPVIRKIEEERVDAIQFGETVGSVAEAPAGPRMSRYRISSTFKGLVREE